MSLSPGPAPLTVLVLEGVGYTRLQEWCRRGLLPGFSRLLAEGRHGPLRPVAVPYEAPMLASAWTGVRPGEHGCFSYWRVHSPERRPAIFESRWLRAPPLWELPALADKRFLLVNLFGSDPSRPGAHTIIGYPFLRTLGGCHPRTLISQLASWGIRYLHDVMAFYEGGPLDEFLALLLRVEDARIRAVASLARERYDVVIANFTIADRVGHFFEHQQPAGAPGEDGGAALAAYRLLDTAVVGPLLEAEGEVLLFSEFGFGPLAEFVPLNDVLASASLFTPSGSPEQPFDMRTRAFEAVQGSHGININLRGRYAGGSVAPADYEAVRADVRACLLEARHPRTGARLLADVLTREAVYPGRALEDAPDLVVLPADERYLPRGDAFWARHVHRHLQTGWHRADGFWLGRGPRLTRAVTGRVAAPEDIAATVLALADREPPLPFTGQPLC
jgi:predicted AlkP superfamily phosphohydrolase/phosphomutase